MRIPKRKCENCGKLATHNKQTSDAGAGAAAANVAEAAPGGRSAAVRGNRRADESQQEILELRAEQRVNAEELAAMNAEIEAEDELHQRLLARGPSPEAAARQRGRIEFSDQSASVLRATAKRIKLLFKPQPRSIAGKSADVSRMK